MANRILRDWTFSENIDLLSYEAESFFTRLIMKADDYGRFHATEKLLKAALYPLRDVPLKTIAKMLTECVNVGVVFCYEVNGKLYLEIPNFGQRLRQMNSRFPEPLPIDRSPLTVDRQPPPEGRKEVETEVEGKKLETPPTPKGEVIIWNDLITFFNNTFKKKSKVVPEAVQKKYNQRLKEGYLKTDISKAMVNASKDSYHIETGFKHLTLEFFSRPDKLDKFCSINPEPIKRTFTPMHNILDHD